MSRRSLRLGFALAALGALSGCDVVVAVLRGLGELGQRPPIAFATADRGQFTRARLFVVALSDLDQAVTLARARPVTGAPGTVEGLRWSPGDVRLAVSFDELIPGGEIDYWFEVRDRALRLELAMSDDNLAGAVQRDCPPISDEPRGLAEFVAREIGFGAFPEGAVTEVRWGEGLIISLGAPGWIDDNRFLVSLESEPVVAVILPDGSEQGLESPTPEAFPEATLLPVRFARNVGRWEVEACGAAALMPLAPRRTPSRMIGVDSDGHLTLDGAVLRNAGGPVAGSQRVTAHDGPY